MKRAVNPSCRTSSAPPSNGTRFGLSLRGGVGIAGIVSGLLIVLIGAQTACASVDVRVSGTPQQFDVVPGEPIRLQLTVRADSAIAFRLHIPQTPLLKLRTIEKSPVRRTAEGLIYQRVVIWQGLEPGTVELTDLSIETAEKKLLFPQVTINVRNPSP